MYSSFVIFSDISLTSLSYREPNTELNLLKSWLKAAKTIPLLAKALNKFCSSRNLAISSSFCELA